tara:strand:- start:920 stop:1324 length:405 start_codon:yes stop_codon:yes gene_type:complete
MENKDKILAMDDCRKDMKKVLKHFYTIRKKKNVEELNYTGVEITHHSVLAVSHNIKESFTQKSLEYHDERGRSPLDIVLTKMFQLGFQNGYLSAKKKDGNVFSTKKVFEIMDENLTLSETNDLLKKQIEDLQNK